MHVGDGIHLVREQADDAADCNHDAALEDVQRHPASVTAIRFRVRLRRLPRRRPKTRQHAVYGRKVQGQQAMQLGEGDALTEGAHEAAQDPAHRGSGVMQLVHATAHAP